MTEQGAKSHPFDGVGAILPTPLEGGAVSVAGIRNLVEHAVDGGCDTLWALGGGGEQPSLDDGRRRTVMCETVAAAKGRRPVVIGIGDCSTEQVFRNLAMAVECGGDAVQLMEPYYYRYSVAELSEHFVAVADASPLPVLLYLHHDRWPDDSFSLSEVSKVIGPLAEHPNIVGVKDAAKDFRDHLRLIVQTRHLDFSVLTSAGRFLNANLSAGGAGGAFHEAVVAPRLYARLQEATRQGAAAALPALLDLASELGDVLGSQDPASAKAACSLMGLCRPDMIPPLKQGTAALMDRLAPLLSKLSDAGFGKLVN